MNSVSELFKPAMARFSGTTALLGRVAVSVDAAWCYKQSSDLSAIVSPAKMAEPIEMPFRLWTWVGPWKHVLDGGAHWRNLANTIEPSMCGGDAALRQINLTTCYRIAQKLEK